MSRKVSLGEFEQERGEYSDPGTARVYGVAPALGKTVIAPAPPYNRQVISGYDSRPIGGYDFTLSDSFQIYDETPTAIVQSPKGFITVVRRIEVIVEDGGLVLVTPVVWVFSSNGVVAVNWRWHTGRVLDHAEIDTFFIVSPDNPFALTAESGLSGLFETAVVRVRFIGNLILDTNEPPTEQVGSIPHTVKVLE